MRRSRSELAAALVLLSTSCAWEDGDPWGIAELTLAVAFAPGPERRTEEGHLRTAGGYAVALDELVLGIDALGVRQGAEAALAFDPADPPPGYDNCHGGHCHADDGRLVSYEEIAAELGIPASGHTVTLPIELEVPLVASPTPVPLADCGEECWLERGPLGSVEVVLHELVASGRAYDLAEEPRLPAAGIPFTLELPLEVAVGAPLPGDAGEEGLVARIDTRFFLAATLLDGVDWPALDATAGPVELTDPAIAGRVESDSLLEASVGWRE